MSALCEVLSEFEEMDDWSYCDAVPSEQTQLTEEELSAIPELTEGEMDLLKAKFQDDLDSFGCSLSEASSCVDQLPSSNDLAVVDAGGSQSDTVDSFGGLLESREMEPDEAPNPVAHNMTAPTPEQLENGHEDQVAGLENFSTPANLGTKLQKIEAKHIGPVNAGILGARHALVAALERHKKSRFQLGQALAEYKTHFAVKSDHAAGARGWMAAARSIAEEMGCNERTIRNIIADYERIASLPSTIIQAAQARGIDLAQRKHCPAVTAIDSIIKNEGHCQDAIDAEKAARIVSKVLVMPPPIHRNRVQDERFVSLTTEEERHFARRMKIRTLLTNIEPAQRLPMLIAAIEEEMFTVWGQRDPVTVTFTPRDSELTIDGRKRREKVA